MRCFKMGKDNLQSELLVLSHEINTLYTFIHAELIPLVNSIAETHALIMKEFNYVEKEE